MTIESPQSPHLTNNRPPISLARIFFTRSIKSGGDHVRLEQKTCWDPVKHIPTVVRNLPPPRPVGKHQCPQDTHHSVDYLELCVSARLALRLDDRPSARTRQECLALVGAVSIGSAAHPDALCSLPPTTIVLIVTWRSTKLQVP